VTATLDADYPVAGKENPAPRRDAKIRPDAMRTPRGRTHLLFGEFLRRRQMHVLDAAGELVGATMAETLLVESGEERHVALGVGSRLDGEPLTAVPGIRETTGMW
jgi:hypothetical protein